MDGGMVPDGEAAHVAEDNWNQRQGASVRQLLREHGARRAGSSPLDKEARRGTCRCAGCGLPVYTGDAAEGAGAHPSTDRAGELSRWWEMARRISREGRWPTVWKPGDRR